MRVDVFFSPQEVAASDVSNRVVAIVDVLRASTSVAVALANGARAVIPLGSSEEVVSRGKSLARSEVKLAGERKMQAIPGFDFGNSPLEFTREAVEGKTILMSTTNGTGAVLSVQGARDVVIASYVNFSAVLSMLRAALRGGTDVAIVCAGQERHFALEDSACAGLFVQHITEKQPKAEINDAAQAAMLIDKKFGSNLKRLFRSSTHGIALADAGFGNDLETCAELDSYSVLPVYQDRQITKLGPERAR
ncbi:MAG TPA: 2-phosphosulfolactate phosphatase [Gemmatimonadaceae bacterium]